MGEHVICVSEPGKCMSEKRKRGGGTAFSFY